MMELEMVRILNANQPYYRVIVTLYKFGGGVRPGGLLSKTFHFYPYCRVISRISKLQNHFHSLRLHFINFGRKQFLFSTCSQYYKEA